MPNAAKHSVDVTRRPFVWLTMAEPVRITGKMGPPVDFPPFMVKFWLQSAMKHLEPSFSGTSFHWRPRRLSDGPMTRNKVEVDLLFGAVLLPEEAAGLGQCAHISPSLLAGGHHQRVDAAALEESGKPRLVVKWAHPSDSESVQASGECSLA
jgi:hypothetical protein